MAGGGVQLFRHVALKNRWRYVCSGLPEPGVYRQVSGGQNLQKYRFPETTFGVINHLKNLFRDGQEGNGHMCEMVMGEERGGEGM